MQCKSGCAQAGQNKKRRADARLSWDGVGKLLVLGLLTNGDLNIVVIELAFFVQTSGQLGALDLDLIIAGALASLLVGRNKIAKLFGEIVLILIIRTVEVGVTQNGSESLVIVESFDDGLDGIVICISNELNRSG